MIIGVIDISSATCNYLNAQHSSYGVFELIVINSNNTISQIAKQAVDKKFSSLFINIEIPFANNNRSSLKGIDFIFWLRLKYKYTGSIITYGFLSSAQILRLYPKYVVIHALGNIHWRLGDELKIVEIPEPIKDINDYSLYLNQFVDTSAIRHSSANYYSLKRLKKFHYAITEETITISELEEDSQMLVYNNLFECDLPLALAKDAENSLNETIEEIKECIKELEDNLRPKRNKGARQGRPIDMYNLDKETLSEMLSGNVNFRLISPRFTKNKNIVNDWEKELKAKKFELSVKFELKENQSKELIEEERRKQLELKITELRSLKGNVALVDDMLDQGWSSFYSTLLGAKIRLTSFSPTTEYVKFNPANFATKILDSKPDVILLDLRLFDNEDIATYPSGIKVLTELRKLNPIVPIIACSASNRGTVINLIYGKGASFHWLKEGLDLEHSIEEGIKNYEKLLDLLQLVLGINQVKIQEQFRQFTCSVDKIDKFWWEEKDWQFEYTIKGEGALLYQTIIEKITKVDSPSDIVNTVKSVLMRFSCLLLERQNKERPDDWKENSELILRLGRLIEHIHRFDVINARYGLVRANIAQYGYHYQYMRANSNVLVNGLQKNGKNILLGRNDKKGYKLYTKRNKAAHFASANLFKNETTLTFIINFIKYLIEDNSAYNDKTVYEKDRNYFWDIDCKQPI